MKPFAALFGIALLVGAVAVAQEASKVEAPGFRPLELPVSAGVARQTGEMPEEGICRVTFCTEDLRRVLIHDSKGSLVVNARSLDIKINTIGELPTVTCKVYEGVFEPTGAPTKAWKLAEMRFVDTTDFQKLVDQGALLQEADVPATTQKSGVPSGVNLQNVTPLIPDDNAKPMTLPITPATPPAPAAAVKPAAKAGPANPSKPGAQ